MKIFISWSGERSKQVATALNEWLPLVLHYAEPWMSDMDIESGTRGLNKIAEELNGRNYGIICVTPENLRAPWINYEAGALSKSVEDGRVVPLLLGLDAKDVPPPLGQFQAKRIEKSGIKTLVSDINKACTSQIDDGKLSTLFDRLWDDLEKKIKEIPPASAAGNVSRKESDILEELVTGMRAIEGKFRDFSNEAGERVVRPPRRLRRLHPMMLMDMSDDFSEKSGDPVFLLMIAGIYREEMPWLSEVLVETYREIRTGSGIQIEAALLRLRRFLKSIGRGHPMFREMMGDSKESYVALMELPHLLERTLDRMAVSNGKGDGEELN